MEGVSPPFCQYLYIFFMTFIEIIPNLCYTYYSCKRRELMRKIQLSAFKVLLDSMNSMLQIMNNSGFRIYDKENKEYYITAIAYDKNLDELEFITDEDPLMGVRLGETPIE